MRRCIALFLICAVMLTGCGFAGTSYKNYVTAVLDSTYHHDYQAYLDMTTATVPDADGMFGYEASVLSDYIQAYFGLKPELISEDMHQGYQKLAEKILQKTKYTVRDVVKSENGYDVTLMLSPIDFWEQTAPEVTAYYENDFTERYSKAPTKESADKLEEVYAFQVLKILNAHADTVSYEPAVTYQFHIQSGENGVSAQTWEEIRHLLLNFE